MMKLFGHGKATTATAERTAQGQARVCPHTALAPHWDSADDMGKTAKVGFYACDVCQQQFSKDEGELMIADVAARLQAVDTARHNIRG